MAARIAVPLTHDAIVDAAIALIERDGPAALTMRRLGAELGVEGMAVYHHVENREAIVRAIGDRLLEPLAVLDLGEDWHEACLRFGRGLRGIARDRPAAFRLTGLQPFDTPASLRAVERLLGVLVAAGFAPADALAAYRAIASYARGYALAEATGFTVDAADPDARRRLHALPEDDFAILRARTGELAQLDADDAFERGLRALVGGLGEAR